MAYSKIKRILLILLCIFVLFFPFWCVSGLCAEEWEQVEYDYVTGIRIIPESNVFTSGNNIGVGYIPIDNNYIYKIVNSGQSPFPVAESNDIPVLNGIYSFLYSIPSGGEYLYRGSNGYLYLDFRTNNIGSIPTVYRQRLSSMDGAVGDLVDNVGPSAIWNIFDTGINYIYVVVIAAFGIFIVALVIKKITKGKEGF